MSVRAVMFNELLHETKPTKTKQEEHVAQRDVVNQKVLKTALYHALHPWRLPQIYYCLFYLLLCSTALKGLYTESLQGAFIRWGFFPLTKKDYRPGTFPQPSKVLLQS